MASALVFGRGVRMIAASCVLVGVAASGCGGNGDDGGLREPTATTEAAPETTSAPTDPLGDYLASDGRIVPAFTIFMLDTAETMNEMTGSGTREERRSNAQEVCSDALFLANEDFIATGNEYGIGLGEAVEGIPDPEFQALVDEVFAGTLQEWMLCSEGDFDGYIEAVEQNTPAMENLIAVLEDPQVNCRLPA
jgi:hypothetical protein